MAAAACRTGNWRCADRNHAGGAASQGYTVGPMTSWPLLLALFWSQEPEVSPAAEAAVQEPAPEPQPLPPAGYGNPDTLPGRLKESVAAGGGTLVELARTSEGRAVLAASFGERQQSGRPEILIVANLAGNRLAASELALRLCQHLAAGSPLLDVATVHVVALANPDGAAHAFAGQDPWRGASVDDDRDGLLDEDGPRDLNGDGRALWMRVRDPRGTLLPDPADPRATREAKKDESEAGGWLLMREGADTDHDRLTAEDSAGGARLDNNFPQRWREHAPESGSFPLSEPETRGLADFVLAHSHLALVIVLDDEDNSASPPKGKDRMDRGASELLSDDAQLLKVWSKRLYGDEGKGAGEAKPRGADDASGSFADWAYFQAGALVLESGLWSPPRETKLAGAEDLAKEAGDEAKELRWQDATYGGAGFVPWQEFTHPDFGAVEIGGWLPLVRDNPPAGEFEALAARWTGFCDALAADFARLTWERVEVKALGGGVFEARALLVNRGLLATMSAAGTVNERPRPVRVTFEVPDGEMLAGRMVQSVESLPGLGGSREFRWIYRAGASGARIRAVSQTAGQALTELEAQ